MQHQSGFYWLYWSNILLYMKLTHYSLPITDKTLLICWLKESIERNGSEPNVGHGLPARPPHGPHHQGRHWQAFKDGSLPVITHPPEHNIGTTGKSIGLCLGHPCVKHSPWFLCRRQRLWQCLSVGGDFSKNRRCPLKIVCFQKRAAHCVSKDACSKLSRLFKHQHNVQQGVN